MPRAGISVELMDLKSGIIESTATSNDMAKDVLRRGSFQKLKAIHESKSMCPRQVYSLRSRLY